MPLSPRPSAPRRLAVASALSAVALAFAACSSSSSSSTTTTSSDPTATTTAPSDPGSPLTALETPPTSTVHLTEDGSSLLYPLYKAWASGFQSLHSNISSTSGNDGSGTGITDAETGTVDIGASDAYLPPATASQYPTLENIPTAISAQVIAYNVPGVTTHLKLDGTVLSDMYDGTIKNWNDPAIAHLNPGVTLPSLAVVPVHRSDSSGDTFLFTTYLADAVPSGWAAHEGASPAASFPSVSGGLAEKGNSGMVAGCGATKGCVAYIGISYLSDIASAGLHYAELQNKAGTFELPTKASIEAEASSFTNVPANGSISLIYGPAAGGYPIINFEYLIVKTNQSSASTAQAIKALIAWAMDPKNGNGSTYLTPVNFQPLPAGALAVSVALLKKIS